MKHVETTKSPSRILVIVTRRIGDVLLATPLIRSLRLAWPEARIEALVFSGTEGVLIANSDVDQVITIEQRPPTLRQHLLFLLRLWRRYDLALSTLPSDRPTLYAFIAGRQRIGLVLAGRKNLWKKWILSQSIQFDNFNTHTVLMNLKLADLLGISRCHEVVAEWKKTDEEAVCKLLPFNPETQSYAVLHVYPMYAYKAWKREAWAELADWLSSKSMRVVLTGGKGENEVAYVSSLLGLLPQDVINLAGKINLAAVAYLLSKARAYVGPDTVVTHIAATVGVPTIALFGPSNPVKWGPWPKGYDEERNPYTIRYTQRVNNVVLLQGSGDCVPCMEEGCERNIASLSACLQNLPAATAIDVLGKLLNLQ